MEDPEILRGDFRRVRSMRKPHGTVFMDGQEVGNTVQCCHCNCVFMFLKGSGKRRGWCFNCNAMTCGQEHCMKSSVGPDGRCLPFEKKLDLYEAGKLDVLR